LRFATVTSGVCRALRLNDGCDQEACGDSDRDPDGNISEEKAKQHSEAGADCDSDADGKVAARTSRGFLMTLHG
jgi:hypothetical protein